MVRPKSKTEKNKCIGCKIDCIVEVPDYVTGYFVVCEECHKAETQYVVANEGHSVYVTSQEI